MRLVLTRYDFSDICTIGRLAVPAVGDQPPATLATLEDPPYPTLASPRGSIPPGEYRLSVTHSPRFNRLLPLLHDVPGFEGIRIHSGNTAADTEGCILVGMQRGAGDETDAIWRSREALELLLDRLTADPGPHTITIEEEKPPWESRPAWPPGVPS